MLMKMAVVLTLLPTFTLFAQTVTETFEPSVPLRFSWKTGGSSTWSLNSGGLGTGWGMIAGRIGDAESTYLEMSTATESGIISFHYRVSSEAGGDHLLFYIDGAQTGSWSGEVDWTHASFFVTAGQHNFYWTYKKDSAWVDFQDTAWVDNISLPLAVYPAPSQNDILIYPNPYMPALESHAGKGITIGGGALAMPILKSILLQAS